MARGKELEIPAREKLRRARATIGGRILLVIVHELKQVISLSQGKHFGGVTNQELAVSANFVGFRIHSD